MSTSKVCRPHRNGVVTHALFSLYYGAFAAVILVKKKIIIIGKPVAYMHDLNWGA